ncbi:FAD-dependent thymidylate synthase [Clostridium magnum]|uniref:FAD-dependent thymidylate synthase n=1 Tax=Clostridium magnum TaxID=33954 RepID=UPI00091F1A74|nr:FAD-dependent thymidylate synthase [Clostridium magnum]SHJ14228.1 thymidylate synthase (FAD) [Clostridium magnum DSM 2767]
MNVKIVEHTPNPERVIASAAKLCYSPTDIDSLLQKQTPDNVEKFLKMLVEMGHESPIEHVSFTFAVEGVSRSLSHQLVRHRIASYSQQSQRYVRLNQFKYIIPPEIAKDSYLKNVYIQHMINSQRTYDELVYGLIASGRSEKEAIEDARYAFPNACETRIMFTMNARVLMNFFKHRCCNRAQWEIKALADEMLKLVKEIAPMIFNYAGPSCLCGICPESKMTCGKINEVKELYG